MAFIEEFFLQKNLHETMKSSDSGKEHGKYDYQLHCGAWNHWLSTINTKIARMPFENKSTSENVKTMRVTTFLTTVNDSDGEKEREAAEIGGSLSPSVLECGADSVSILCCTENSHGEIGMGISDQWRIQSIFIQIR